MIKSSDLCVDTSVKKKMHNTQSLELGYVDDPSTTIQHANETTNTESADAELSKMSYLFDGELYNNVSLDGIKVSAKCTTCFKVINGHTTSTGNFLSHIKVPIFLLLFISLFIVIYLFIYCYNIYLFIAIIFIYLLL